MDHSGGCIDGSFHRDHAGVLFRYCDQGTMRFPRPLRKLALAAAATYVVGAALRFHGWAGPLRTALDLFAGFSYVALLISMSREVDEDASAQTPVSDLLRVITQTATVAWGIWVAFQIVRLAGVTFTYSSLKTFAYRDGGGRDPYVLFSGLTSCSAVHRVAKRLRPGHAPKPVAIIVVNATDPGLFLLFALPALWRRPSLSACN